MKNLKSTLIIPQNHSIMNQHEMMVVSIVSIHILERITVAYSNISHNYNTANQTLFADWIFDNK
jgi:hypothetical protein